MSRINQGDVLYLGSGVCACWFRNRVVFGAWIPSPWALELALVATYMNDMKSDENGRKGHSMLDALCAYALITSTRPRQCNATIVEEMTLTQQQSRALDVIYTF